MIAIGLEKLNKLIKFWQCLIGSDCRIQWGHLLAVDGTKMPKNEILVVE